MKSLTTILVGILFSINALASEAPLYWIKIAAKDATERTKIEEMGRHIEAVEDDYVVVIGEKNYLKKVQEKFKVLVSFRLTAQMMDFPDQDDQFHNYTELSTALQKLAVENSDLVKLESIGKSMEDRDIWALTITANQDEHLDQPGSLFLGGHHAREHLSVEMPLKLAQELVAKYRAGDERITGYLNTRSIYIIPVVNPDGKEHDIATGRYRMWRKNRRLVKNGVYGVDLNRNYGYQWGTVGISFDPTSDVYPGEGPFSEPETQAVRDFYLAHENLTVNLSFHTFSELILYPWGHKHAKLPNPDYDVHRTMAVKMAEWNGYTPQSGSDLYLVSGDTSDWAYGELGLVSFTFELDPKSMWSGGFYPGQSFIEPVFRKNWEPCLYLIEYSDNPYRVVEGQHESLGFNTPLFQ